MTLYGLGMNTETPTDSPEFTVRECLQFVERYRANEYIPPAKAKNWTIALKSLSFGDEDQDVRQMEMDDLVLRYINEGASPETATAYGQRAIRCRLVFLDYKKNPKAFKPVTARKLAPR